MIQLSLCNFKFELFKSGMKVRRMRLDDEMLIGGKLECVDWILWLKDHRLYVLFINKINPGHFKFICWHKD